MKLPSRAPAAPVLLLLGLLLAACAPAARAPNAQPAEPTVVLVVRHAERADDGSRDPALSAAGEARARALAETAATADVGVVITTQFQRTHATGASVADRCGCDLVIAEVGAAGVEAHVEEIAQQILRDHLGKTVLVVGHSNTAPAIAQRLSGQSAAEISESEYDRLFIVVIPAGGEPRLVQARYGASG